MTTLVVTIAIALIGAFVSFVGVILSKEQKISEFRLSWIEALRDDLAYLIARVQAIHATLKGTPGPINIGTPQGLKLREEFLELTQASVRIKLRLNPKKESHKAVITLMDENEKLFETGIGNAAFDQIDDFASRITEASQQLLRSVWEEVKRGEPVFRVTKWISLAIAVLALLLLVVALSLQPRTPGFTNHGSSYPNTAPLRSQK